MNNVLWHLVIHGMSNNTIEDLSPSNADNRPPQWILPIFAEEKIAEHIKSPDTTYISLLLSSF